MEMIEFTSETVDKILNTEAGMTVDCEVIGDDDNMTVEQFTVVEHVLDGGIEIGSDNGFRIISKIRSEDKLATFVYDLVFKPGYGYRITCLDGPNIERIW